MKTQKDQELETLITMLFCNSSTDSRGNNSVVSLLELEFTRRRQNTDQGLWEGELELKVMGEVTDKKAFIGSDKYEVKQLAVETAANIVKKMVSGELFKPAVATLPS